MRPHREYQTYRKHTLTVEMDKPGGLVLQVWIAGYKDSFATVKKAEAQIDKDLTQAVAGPPPPDEPGEEEPPSPQRPRMRP